MDGGIYIGAAVVGSEQFILEFIANDAPNQNTTFRGTENKPTCHSLTDVNITGENDCHRQETDKQ